jgi:hypothetical protein
MRINLHIERLVLEGFALSGRDGALVEEAVQVELARLLTQGGEVGMSPYCASMPILHGDSIRADTPANPLPFGAAIAQSIYGALAK